MSAAVQVVMCSARSTMAAVMTTNGCGCLIDPGTPALRDILLFRAGFAAALDFAVAHAATHTCPSWRASGERCTERCTDCGGRGWVA